MSASTDSTWTAYALLAQARPSTRGAVVAAESHIVLAKLTSKNQLTLPKSVTDQLGPVQYFEVQLQSGQVVLTPVRIQRGDAVRAKLAELELDEGVWDDALAWAEQASGPRTRATAIPKASKSSRAAVASAESASASVSVVKKPSQKARKGAASTLDKQSAKPVRATTSTKTSAAKAVAKSARTPKVASADGETDLLSTSSATAKKVKRAATSSRRAG